jgi:hypothetical protein
MDGVPVERWLDAARSVTAAACPAFVRRNATRTLRFVGWLRQELDLPVRDDLEVTLANEGGTERAVRSFPLAARKPVYGEWPRTGTRRLPGGAGYLRIADMEDDESFVRGVVAALDGFRDAPGVVIDVRGNGGGSRDVLRALLPRFLEPGTTRIANVAAYRRPPDEAPDAREGHLADRFLWPATASVWAPAARSAIERFERTFSPEWTPDPAAFSAWHHLAIDGGTAARFDRPVAVLLDEGCFSATDVFLAAFRGVPGVTLVGTTTGAASSPTFASIPHPATGWVARTRCSTPPSPTFAARAERRAT